MDKLRVIVALFLLTLFAVSVFTAYPVDSATRNTLGLLAVGAAGFLFGPTFLRRPPSGDGKG